jgi:hypothetical protein
METKRCWKCKTVKLITEFSKNRKTSDGINGRCKACDKQYSIENIGRVKQYRLANKESRNQYIREYRNTHPEMVNKWRSTLPNKFRMWKKGAMKRGIPFEVTYEFVKSIPMICHYTGMPLQLDVNSYYTASLDRLDSSKGYTADNVVLCCAFINLMKQQLTYDQFIMACRGVVQHHDSKD